jgi:hypothetical protein
VAHVCLQWVACTSTTIRQPELWQPSPARGEPSGSDACWQSQWQALAAHGLELQLRAAKEHQRRGRRCDRSLYDSFLTVTFPHNV